MLRRLVTSISRVSSHAPHISRGVVIPVFSSYISFSARRCFASSSLTRFSSAPQSDARRHSSLDLDDDADDERFQQALLKQQQQQHQQHHQEEEEGKINNQDTNTASTTEAERREKTRQFLRIISDIGVVPISSSSPTTSIENCEQAVQTLRDMLTAAVKLHTLTGQHVRRLFAQCGELQRGDASREMWIRMLTVTKTVIEAETELYYEENSLYRASDDDHDDVVVAGHDHGGASTSTRQRTSVISPEAWNALFGLSVDFVIKKRSASSSSSSSSSSLLSSSKQQQQNHQQRAVLQSELELVLGAAQSEEPHWWVLREMDKRGVEVRDEKLLQFVAKEVNVSSNESSSGSSRSGGGGGGKNEQQPRREPAMAELGDDAASAALMRPPVKKAVLESRVALVLRQLQK